MRLDCPSCEANYEIPDHLFKPGRRMRCARCGVEWLAPIPADAAGADPPPDDFGFDEEHARAPEPVAVAQPPAPIDTPVEALVKESGEPAAPSVALLAAWGASVVGLVAGAACVVIWRGAITAAWPPAARLLGWG